MTDARALATSERKAPRGRIDKRRAILDAAFTVFSRQGYAQACVNEIANEAGVAKPTVYNHLTDKANLFRHAIEAAAESLTAENLAAVERLAERHEDLRTTLEDVAHELLRVYCDERSWSLRRLLYAEIARFPDLVDLEPVDGSATVARALADRFARLSLAGRLRLTDPDQAARQFFGLLTGPVEIRARFGTRPVPDSESREIVVAAVDTFLRAFAAPTA
ncbi:TetR/AcrR family transcriptional regulator [Plantactinospora sp. KLBMP9567]|uniref:TetR/AcrR family transcriptional regulator n=1 Tax=Plantactinospora sp. KLBMP9567 TaxID=3085900 RepID=UPI00298163D9|nr:TetR/AcrR family transcriptional regulator [Plantactinospora sp. KLBMP9567]MDW5329505.1 TetR/AcrR family transcriptional regulator [Plantactinospora sp. KLBMP9567]